MTNECGHWKSMKLKRLEKRLADPVFYIRTFRLSQILFKEDTSFALILGGKHANAVQ